MDKNTKNAPQDYGRWGKMGIKVISKPTEKKGGKKDA